MILIADSGSTKTHWCVLGKDGFKKEIFTKGINPFYQTEVEIQCEIAQALLPQLGELSIKQIFFYGAGCSLPDKKAMVSKSLGACFQDVVIEVESDLLGAARALCGHDQGIACILGTGSNSCYYDGKFIVNNVSPLGFILGDEGSGAVLGKMLIADCLKNQLSLELKDALFHEYGLTYASILDAVYKKSFPNRFLAGLTPFLLKYLDNPSIYKIVYDGFESFVKRNVVQYPVDANKVGFVGSVAYYFKNVLVDVLNKYELECGQIMQAPMDGLVVYHMK